jgi:hypothetical protein
MALFVELILKEADSTVRKIQEMLEIFSHIA